jgi:hypothetical protein
MKVASLVTALVVGDASMRNNRHRPERALFGRSKSQRRTVMRRKLVCIGLVIAAVAFASADAGAGANIPFKATDTFASALVGPPGTVVQTAETGSGNATHLGHFTMVASETVDFGTLAVTNGQYTLTAANGDTVSGTYSGHIVPGLTGYLVSGPITDGTGRFEGATGFLVWRGTFDPVTFTGSDVITGTISSVGSI